MKPLLYKFSVSSSYTGSRQYAGLAEPAEPHEKARMKEFSRRNCSKVEPHPARCHFTVEDLSQSLVFRLGVAKLDVLVRVPGEARPPQRDFGPSARRVVVDQSEGV